MNKAVIALLLAVVTLMALGLVMLASLQGAYAGSPQLHQPTLGLMVNQLIWIGIGLVIMGAVSRVDYRRWRQIATPFAGMVFMLLVVALVPGMGPNYYGARRWLYLGPWGTFQPSVLAGLAIVLFMAWWYSSENPRSPNLFWVPVAVMYGWTTLIFVEPDFSVAVFVLLTGWVLMILGKARYDHIIISIVLPVTGLMWAISKDPFSRAGLMDFFTRDPIAEPACLPGFVMALKAGGWAGVGLGNGHWTRWFLPEASGGLVTAVIGEELGLAALLIMMGMFAVMVVSGAYIAAKASDRFGTLLGTGMVALLIIPVLLNLVSVTWLFPMKALLLPLVSHGGWALCATLTGVGVLLNIARTKPGESNEPK